MKTYLALFTASALLALFATPILVRVSVRYGWVSKAHGSSRSRNEPVSVLGGAAIFISVLIALSTLLFIDNLITRPLASFGAQFYVVLIPATLMLSLGAYDDIRGINPFIKFGTQVLVCTLFYLMGGQIYALSVPFIGSTHLPAWMSYIASLLWLISITNSFKLIEGVDGLVSGVALFASLTMLVVSLILGNTFITVITLALSGALVGFLRYNLKPPSIYLGNGGTFFLGFLLAALSIMGVQKASTAIAVAIPLIAFGLPVIDTGFTVVRRLVSGASGFQTDGTYIQPELATTTWSPHRIGVMLFSVCALFGLLALLFVSDKRGSTTGFALFVIGVVVVFVVGRLRRHEADEVMADMKRSLGERRLRVANNVRVRRACRSMAEAATLSEIFEAVLEMLDFGEFVYATVQLGRSVDAERNLQALARERGEPSLRTAEVRGGVIHWSWERGDAEETEILGSDRFWAIRMPLSLEGDDWGYLNLYRGFDKDTLSLDINYLCDLFQHEMTCAAARVLGGSATGRSHAA